MNLSLPIVQRLLAFSALAWAMVPTWGGVAFGASWTLLWLATRSRERRARALLERSLDALGAIPAPGLALLRRFPLATVWPSCAERWGTTWQMTGLLALFEGGIFALWALGSRQWWHLGLLAPASVQLVSGGWMARRLKLADRVTEDLADQKAAYEQAMTVLRLKTALGQWPPEPAPDPEPLSKKPPPG